MNIRDSLTMFIAGVIYVAILYVLVRPGSPGATTIATISSALENLVKTSTGFTTPQG